MALQFVRRKRCVQIYDESEGHTIRRTAIDFKVPFCTMMTSRFFRFFFFFLNLSDHGFSPTSDPPRFSTFRRLFRFACVSTSVHVYLRIARVFAVPLQAVTRPCKIKKSVRPSRSRHSLSNVSHRSIISTRSLRNETLHLPISKARVHFVIFFFLTFMFLLSALYHVFWNLLITIC
jgi:hypothetical protein